MKSTISERKEKVFSMIKAFRAYIAISTSSKPIALAKAIEHVHHPSLLLKEVDAL
jgi:hypothetical protein